MSENPREYLKELHDLYRNDQLIIFVGAGVSKNSNYPDWNDLTSKVVKELGLFPIKNIIFKKETLVKNKTYIKKCLKKLTYKNYTFQDHIFYAQCLYNKSEKVYEKLLKDTFKVDRESSELHKKIMDLNQTHIVTTNYDSLLEDSNSYTCSQYETIKSDGDLLSSNKKKRIIKMHGDIKAIKSIVLKEDDYLNFTSNKKAIHNYLNHLFFEKSILFIGYGLNDQNVKQILNDLAKYSKILDKKNKTRHFFLTYKPKNDKKGLKTYYYNKKLLKKRGVQPIEVNKYKSMNYGSSIKNDTGKSLYNFLCSIESFSLYDLTPAEQEHKLLSRFEKLDFQTYVSTADFLNILEINEYKTPIKSTSRTLYIFNLNIYEILKKGYENQNSKIYSVLNKTFLHTIELSKTKGQARKDSFEIVDHSKNKKRILGKLCSKRIENIFVENQNNYFFRETDPKNIVQHYKNKNLNSDNYNNIRNQINHILLNHLFERAKNPKKWQNIEEKIELLSNSLDYENSKQYSVLFNTGNYKNINMTNYIIEIIGKIEEECNRSSGISFSYIDYFGELDKFAQSIYLYPILNGIATSWFDGEYASAIKELANAYLSPFKSKYKNRKTGKGMIPIENKQFNEFKLEFHDILLISDFFKTNDLLTLLWENKINKISVDFENEYLLDFLDNYLGSLEKNALNKNPKKENKFIQNLLVFVTLIDLNVLTDLEKYFRKYPFFIEYLKFYNNRFISWGESVFSLTKEFYNEFFFEYLNILSIDKKNSQFNKEYTISDFDNLLFVNKELISDKNKKLLLVALNKINTKDKIPLWVYAFSKYLDKTSVSEITKKRKLTTEEISNLIIHKYIPCDENTLDIMKQSRPEYTSKNGLITDAPDNWYPLILQFCQQIKYSKIELLWSLFLDPDKKYKENYVHNIVNYGSFNEASTEISILEAKLLMHFLKKKDLCENLDFIKINDELREMEKKDLLGTGGALVKGALHIAENSF